MSDLKLSVAVREKGKKKAGMIPAVLYGKGIKNQNLWVNEGEFIKLEKEAGGNTLVELKVDGEKESANRVLIYDFQKDPLTDRFIHVDFYQVRMDEQIEAGVGIIFEGEAPAVKELGGVLLKNMDEIEVRCLPMDLPKEIKVDLSVLKTFDDRVYVKDLELSDKVEIDLDSETVVASVVPPRSEEELSELDEAVDGDISGIEGMEEKEAEEQESGEKDGAEQEKSQEPKEEKKEE